MSSDSDDFEDNYIESGDNSGDESDDYVPEKKAPAKKTGKLDDFFSGGPSVNSKNVAKPKKVPAKRKLESDEESDASKPKTKAKPKATPKPKAAPKGKALLDNTSDDASSSTPSTPKPKSSGYSEEKTIEEIYQKKTQLEHILLRPDSYIGSIETEQQEVWVFNSELEVLEKKSIRYVPGLYKIVDEILVNAADNKIRDPSMSEIRVTISTSENLISIQNNGRGIPITIHKDEKIYVPELIFGHLLTSSNYNDDEKKVVGGRNGYGAKLCNIFSTEFTVETGDKEAKLKYRQVFKNNMSFIGKPTINKGVTKDFTRITFKPDLRKFHMEHMDEDFESLIKKRVYDLAGCVKGVNVYLNGTKIPVQTFPKYCDLYAKNMELRSISDKKFIIMDDGKQERWQVGFGVSDGQFTQVSFVNSICTAKGGTHVNYIADQIVKVLVPELKKKDKNVTIKNFQIKSHMAIFVNCLIENPSFDSQTKENMTLRASSFGSTYTLEPSFVNKILKSGIIDSILRWAKFKEDQSLTKADSGKMARRLNIPKLEDANLAGVRPHNKKCTLILTEGDSAKALVLSGMSVVGRDLYGVFPLRGKLLNVRDASINQIKENSEITNIKAILGLKHNHTYTSVDELRYGKLMIMTDQDHDGSHIKGLVINFIDQLFPSLLDIPGFLLEFITPIIRCKHKTRKNDVINFYTIPEYEQWAATENVKKEWNAKYYKGLGTSDKSDAREYFNNLDVHMKEFVSPTEEERGLIDMAFNKKKVQDRKNWLSGYTPGIYIDHSVSKIKITDFVHRELMLYSMADNIRSIPSMVDGLKPGQRKVLFGAIKRRSNSEMKVAQFANYVASATQYHHGEQSIAATVIGMAQDFVGSNNINLLNPSGQFGTRHDGGKSAAAPRYLFTNLHKITRTIYHPDDDAILNYLLEEDKPIEPEWYVPILPMVLINGADGIGTGWSTSIPNYNPKDIADNILRLMDDEEVSPMKPWFRGFKGAIEPAGPGRFQCDGIANVTDEGWIKVEELPVRYWTDSFKDHLEGFRDNKDKEKKKTITIEDFTNNSTDVAVEFTIELTHANLNTAEDNGLLKTFKLTSNILTSNFVCFDKEGKIKKYGSAEEILHDFYEIRLEYYKKRKEHMIEVLRDEYERLDNKAKFIQLVIDKKLVYINRKQEDVVKEMKENNLKQFFNSKQKKAKAADEESSDEEEGEDTSKDSSESGFEYLFNLNVRAFTVKKVADLNKQRDNKFEQLETIQGTAPKTFWRKDIEKFLLEWDAVLEKDEEIAKNAEPLKTSSKKKRSLKSKGPKTVKKQKTSSKAEGSSTSSAIEL